MSKSLTHSTFTKLRLLLYLVLPVLVPRRYLLLYLSFSHFLANFQTLSSDDISPHQMDDCLSSIQLYFHTKVPSLDRVETMHTLLELVIFFCC